MSIVRWSLQITRLVRIDIQSRMVFEESEVLLRILSPTPASLHESPCLKWGDFEPHLQLHGWVCVESTRYL